MSHEKKRYSQSWLDLLRKLMPVVFVAVFVASFLFFFDHNFGVILSFVVALVLSFIGMYVFVPVANFVRSLSPVVDDDEELPEISEQPTDAPVSAEKELQQFFELHDTPPIMPKEPIITYVKNDDSVRCPKCRSTQITAKTKGFGLGKAAAGGLLLGPVGLLGGVIGSKKTIVVCLACGHEWRPGK